jgi:geranylgeranyl transferase type-1 subunit beta
MFILCTCNCVYLISDALHAYFGVCGLSLMGEEGLQPMHAALNISKRAADFLTTVQVTWSQQS